MTQLVFKREQPDDRELGMLDIHDFPNDPCDRLSSLRKHTTPAHPGKQLRLLLRL